MSIMKIDVDALEQAAAAVGPEQWFEDGTGTIYLCPSHPVSGPGACGMEVVEVYLRTDGKDGQRQRFIAAANPAVVLELVRLLRRTEANYLSASKSCSDYIWQIETLKIRRTQNQARRADDFRKMRAMEEALRLARPILQEDRQALLDGHTFHGTDEVEDCAREPLARYDEALAAINDLIPH